MTLQEKPDQIGRQRFQSRSHALSKIINGLRNSKKLL